MRVAPLRAAFNRFYPGDLHERGDIRSQSCIDFIDGGSGRKLHMSKKDSRCILRREVLVRKNGNAQAQKNDAGIDETRRSRRAHGLLRARQEWSRHARQGDKRLFPVRRHEPEERLFQKGKGKDEGHHKENRYGNGNRRNIRVGGRAHDQRKKRDDGGGGCGHQRCGERREPRYPLRPEMIVDNQIVIDNQSGSDNESGEDPGVYGNRYRRQYGYAKVQRQGNAQREYGAYFATRNEQTDEQDYRRHAREHGTKDLVYSLFEFPSLAVYDFRSEPFFFQCHGYRVQVSAKNERVGITSRVDVQGNAFLAVDPACLVGLPVPMGDVGYFTERHERSVTDRNSQFAKIIKVIEAAVKKHRSSHCSGFRLPDGKTDQGPVEPFREDLCIDVMMRRFRIVQRDDRFPNTPSSCLNFPGARHPLIPLFQYPVGIFAEFRKSQKARSE